MFAMDFDDGASESAASSAVSFGAFSMSRASSNTSFSMRSGSPTPSVTSVTSSLRADAYRDEFGRAVNTRSEIYRLPADEVELGRLDMQHEMFKQVFGQYPPPMRNILRTVAHGDPKAILDLGCGSGSWTMEAARDFPDCSVVGVDLVPMQDVRPLPPNMRAEVDDINLGLDHFYGDFDVVHARLIASGITNYTALVDECSHILRPGGLVILMESEFLIADEHGRPIRPTTSVMEAPWLPRWMAFVNMAIKHRGGDIEAGASSSDIVAHHPAFEEVCARDVYIGVSPWMVGDSEDARFRRWAATQMRADMKEFMLSARPLLLGSGMSQALLHELESNARRELDEARTPLLVRLHHVYARKRRLVPP